MHNECLRWLEGLKRATPDAFRDVRVLECGSFDVNGNPRHLFEDADYVGLDAREGKGVDVVSLVHEYQPLEKFDVVMSLNSLEHDPHWSKSIGSMCGFLKAGGALMLSWAMRWPEHEKDGSPEPGYYRNLTERDVQLVLKDCPRIRS